MNTVIVLDVNETPTAVGCRAVFVARPGMVLTPIGAQPDIAAVVEQILATDAQ
jgi:hypothetical protein